MALLDAALYSDKASEVKAREPPAAAPYALVAGCAVRQDGRSNGLMAPRPAAQVDLLREAYADAMQAPADVAYVEAHGTGTRLGDPIELHALGQVKIGRGAPGAGVPVGTIKSNIGHLECAAGMAGLVKAALVLQHRTVPASLHFRTPNRLVAFENLHLRVVAAPEPLVPPSSSAPSSRGTAVLGISGNGFGGTLGHCVLVGTSPLCKPNGGEGGGHLPHMNHCARATMLPEGSVFGAGDDAGAMTTSSEPQQDSRHLVVVALSAHSVVAARRTAGRLASLLEGEARKEVTMDPTSTRITLAEVALAAGAGRPHAGPHRQHRIAVAGVRPLAVAAALWAAADGRTSCSGGATLKVAQGLPASGAAGEGQPSWGPVGAAGGTAEGAAAIGEGRNKRVAMVFTGQGAEYARMGTGLRAFDPSFAAAFAAVERALAPHLRLPRGEALGDLLAHGPEDALKDPAVLQPAVFAVEYALACALLSHARGAWPLVAVAGHSLGELAAMAVAGVLTLEQAAALVAGRGRAMAELAPSVGGMAALDASEDKARCPTGPASERLPVRAVLEELHSELRAEVAAVNGPQAVVVSGRDAALEALRAVCEARGIRFKRLAVHTAMHSHCVEPCLQDLRHVANSLPTDSKPDAVAAAATTVCAGAGSITVVSTLTGGVLLRPPDADYWCRQARERVRFSEAIRCLVQEWGAEVVIEVGPAPHLTPHVRATLDALGAPHRAAKILPTLRGRKAGARAEAEAFCAVQCALHCAGVAADWAVMAQSAAHAAGEGRLSLARLPPTALVGEEHWFSGAALCSNSAAPACHEEGGRGARGIPAAPVLGPDSLLWGEEWVAAPKQGVWGPSLRGRPRTALVAGCSGCGLSRIVLNELLRSGVRAEAFELRGGEDADGPAPGAAVGDLIRRLRRGPSATGATSPGADVTSHTRCPSMHWDLVVLLLAGPHCQTRPVLGGAFSPRRKASGGGSAGTRPMSPRSGSVAQTGRWWRSWRRANDADASLTQPLLGEQGPRDSLLGEQDVDLEVGGAEQMAVPHGRMADSLPSGTTSSHPCRSEKPAECGGGYWPESKLLHAVSILLEVLQTMQANTGVTKRLALITQGVNLGSSPPPVLSARGAMGAAMWGLLRSARHEMQLLPHAPLLHAVDLDDALAPETVAAHLAAELLGAEENDGFGCEDVRLVACRSSRNNPGREEAAPSLDILSSASPDSMRGAGAAASPAQASPSKLQGEVLREIRRIAPFGAASQPSVTAESAEPPNATARPVQVPAVVAISGGTGALGLVVGRYFLERGARALLLLSRSGDVPVANQALHEEVLAVAAAHEARVYVLPCDVGNAAEVEALVAAWQGELGGIVHAAGVLDDGLLANQTAERLAGQLRGKALGALNLFHACQAHAVELRLFLLFSSVTALQGNAGQSGYGAANAVLDHLAAVGVASGVPTISVQWGPWAEVGMAARNEAKVLGRRSVYHPITVAEALEALRDVMERPAGSAAVVAVARFNWERVLRDASASRFQARLWSSCNTSSLMLPPSAERMPSSTLEHRHRAHTGAAPHSSLLEPAQAMEVERELSEVLRQYCGEAKGGVALDLATPLVDLGLDSVGVMSAAHDISQRMGVSVTLEELTATPGRVPTVRSLSDHIRARLPASSQGPRLPPLRTVQASPTARSTTPNAQPLASSKTDDVLSRLLRLVAGRVGDEGVPSQQTVVVEDTPLQSLALDSIEMMAMVQELCHESGATLGLPEALECATLGSLAELVRSRQRRHRPSGAAQSLPHATSSPSSARRAPEGVRARVARVLRACLEGDVEAGPSSSVVDLGLDSVQGMALVQELDRELGTQMDFPEVMGLGTVENLAASLELRDRPLKDPSSRVPVHGGAGSCTTGRRASADVPPCAECGDVCDDADLDGSRGRTEAGASSVLAPLSPLPPGDEAELAKLRAEREVRRRQEQNRSGPGLLGRAAMMAAQWTLRLAYLGASFGLSLGYELSLAWGTPASLWYQICCAGTLEGRSWSPRLEGGQRQGCGGCALGRIATIAMGHIVVCAASAMLAFTALKWGLLGRCLPGRYHRWKSWYGIRFQLFEELCEVALPGISLACRMLPDELCLCFYRLLGAKIGRGVLMPVMEASNGFWKAADLVELSDGVVLHDSSDLITTNWETANVNVHKRIMIGRRVRVNGMARVMGGARIGDECIIAWASQAQGNVAPRAIVTARSVLPDSPSRVFPGSAADCIYRLPQGDSAVDWRQLAGQAMWSAVFVIYFSCAVAVALSASATTLTALGGRVLPSEARQHFSLRAQGGLEMLVYCTLVPGLLVFYMQVYFVLGSLAAKWTLIGRRRPGKVKITRWSVLARWVVKRLVHVGVVCVTVYFDNTAVLALYYRLLGGGLRACTVPSTMRGVEADIDLLSVGKDVYFGNGVGVSSVSVDIHRGEATFFPTVIEDGVFIGPASYLLCGAALQARSSVGALSIVGSHQTVPTGITQIAHDLQLVYRQEPLLRGKYAWAALSVGLGSYHWAAETVIFGFALYSCCLLPYARAAAYLTSLALQLAAVMVSLQLLCLQLTVASLVHCVALKWALLGRTQPKIPYAIRGARHAAWVLTWHLCQTSAARYNMALGRDMHALTSAVMRLMGAKIGDGVSHLNGLFLYPEMDMLDLGDGVSNGCVAYGHDFHKLHMVFKRCILHPGCTLPVSGTQVLPGVTLPSFTSCSPSINNILPGSASLPRKVLHGNPARPSMLGPNDEYLVDGDGIVVHDYFN
ncbi:hypothetical protein CYMTET_49466 [Cymbomonas tetramitiformis]|uniref:Carrier domain-containing protein n=1 Tax=Cymbomonas tetramitiformis TaxID=36881 RepID=A0AAE0EUP0_9CHLO|nr:hypothetical protein CYMTET_49466 [Cymbomonas tetramitiformis]